MQEKTEISWEELCEMYRQQMICYREIAETRKAQLQIEMQEYLELDNELKCLKQSLNMPIKKSRKTLSIAPNF